LQAEVERLKKENANLRMYLEQAYQVNEENSKELSDLLLRRK
jgi:hypothetical protein